MHVQIDKYTDINNTVLQIEEIMHKYGIHATTTQIEIYDLDNNYLNKCKNYVCNNNCEKKMCCNK
jgi:ribosomal protein S24E